MDLQALLESGALSIEALTADINELPHTPTRIGDMRLFSEEGIDTTIALIGLSDDKLTRVPNVPRGSPSQPKQLGPKNAKPFLVPHLPQRSTVMADSLQGARTFGKQGSEVEAAAAKVVALNGKHRRDLDYTIEYHRLGAIKGLILDAVPETAPIKPKAEIAERPAKQAKPRKAKETVAAEAAPAKAKSSKKAAEAKAEEPKDEPPRKSSGAVPKVPRKK